MSKSEQQIAPSRPALSGPGRIRPGTHLGRAAFAVLCNDAGIGNYLSPADAAEKLFPGDPVTPRLILRSATVPASLASTAWAGVVAPTVVGDFLASLAPSLSAGARLIDAGMTLSLDGVYSTLLPLRSGLPAGDDVWTGEGAPIRVKQYQLTSAEIGPMKKLASIVAMTGEAARHTTAETLLTTLLREDMGASLDVALFSTAAASALRPAGLLNGVTPMMATAGGGEQAMMSDLERLAVAIANAGGSGSVVYIANPKQAVSAALRLPPGLDVTVWPSRGVPADTVIAIDPTAFVSAFGPIPNIRASIETLVHMQDANPAAIGTEASPNVVAAPARSAFQTDAVFLRCILDAAWTMRASGLVRYLTGASWGSV